MQKEITGQIIEEVFDSINSVGSEDEIQELMDNLAEEQEALLGFVLDLTKDMTVETREIGMYATLVIYQCFKDASDEKIPQIESDVLEKGYKKHFDSLISEDTEIPEDPIMKKQERLFAAVDEILSEVDELENEETAVESDSDDGDILFAMCQTLIEQLDKVTK